MSDKCVLLVCGGGNGAHVIGGLAAADPLTEVRILTMFGDEAERWTNTLKTNDFTVRRKKQGSDLAPIVGKPNLVSKDPSCAKGCNFIVLVVPAFGHGQYLTALKPYIGKGSTIIGLPGQAGFEFEIRGVLGDLAKDITIGNFESLPWACRIVDYGKEVEVLGTKALLAGALMPGKTKAAIPDPVGVLQRIVGKSPILRTSGHILGMTLMATNAYLHPSILYGKWHDYKGAEMTGAPLFYEEMTELAATTLDAISKEVLAVAKGIMDKTKEDLKNVEHIFDWFMRCYAAEITDKRNLRSAISTNSAYAGLKHPMRAVEGDNNRLVPDWSNRYFSEDGPYGLAVIRGIAEIAEVPTPTLDKVLLWMQSKTGKEYLKNGKFEGANVSETRAPQKYGYTNLNQLLGK
jgi:hypothetical protein